MQITRIFKNKLHLFVATPLPPLPYLHFYCTLLQTECGYRRGYNYQLVKKCGQIEFYKQV